ncbi:glutamate receptor-interacting protein 1 [Lingula anatina]|uniref:Glutamate receptor-interacting protein 1 n=1 Tax=Lingula anatina TaxID=7574 RepID=A0A1S3IFS6_LINAN|nr:glutamate receptor-interacting protein 1 [Lingula anatina]|eukprot:XP_013397105.1 glutamate receptor-interacting protein 1 [Lingula anatina]
MRLKLCNVISDSQNRGSQIEEAGWEIHKVQLSKVPVLGFGIAVSGGIDSPQNGDNSILISDVLKTGPANGKLQINDRVISVNGSSFDHIDHSSAIGALENCGNTMDMVIRRLVVLSDAEEHAQASVAINEKNEREYYNIVLGSRFYIKETICNRSVARDCGNKEGKTVIRINKTATESLVNGARKIMEKSKDKLRLVVKKASIDSKKQISNNNCQMDVPVTKRKNNMNKTVSNLFPIRSASSRVNLPQKHQQQSPALRKRTLYMYNDNPQPKPTCQLSHSTQSRPRLLSTNSFQQY